MESMLEWQNKCMEQHGWYVHATPGNDPYMNYHTHGLDVTFKHLDLQIVFPINPEIAHGILMSAIDLIKTGTKLEDGKHYDQIIQNFSVECILAEECDRQVIRLILPEQDGALGIWNMKEQIYKGQYF
jgi:hypothetical protein